MNDPEKIAAQVCKTYKTCDFSVEDLIRVAEDQGFKVVFFNALANDADVTTLSQGFTFESNGKVTTSAAGLDLVSGTYKIENGKITFSFNTDGILEIAGNSLGLNHSMTFEKKGNSIFLDGTEYVKE